MDEAKNEKKEETVERTAAPLGEAAEEELDLEDLDLSVETVEERISPSETNVFDK